MKKIINDLIELEKNNLGEDKKKLISEAENLNISIAMNDYKDDKEIELTIRMMARIRNLKEL